MSGSANSTGKIDSTQLELGQLQVTAFKAKLRLALDSLEGNQLDPASPLWRGVQEYVNQDVLNDAFSHTAEVAALIVAAEPGLVLGARPVPKSNARFEVKASYGGYDKHGNPSYSDWKSVHDFISFRIPTTIQDMTTTVQRLVSAIEKNGGKYYIKPDKKGGQIFIEGSKDSLPKDLCCYIYGYLPSVGYVAEFQVNHPFASFTFARDSLLRDNRQLRKELADMWEEKFYGTIRNALLRPEGPTEDDKLAIKEKITKVYQGKKADPELIKILEDAKLL